MIDEQTEQAPRARFWRELPILLGVAILVAVLVRAFVLQTFYIPSQSMEHTLNINDRVLVNKLVYDFRSTRTAARSSCSRRPTNWRSGPDERGLHQAGHRRRRRPHRLLRRAAAPDQVNGHPLDEPYIYPPRTASATRPRRAVRHHRARRAGSG